MKLSERLSLIASLVPAGSAVVDVGTDHAYLPAALFLRGGMRSVTATDINEKPLKSAMKTLEKSGAQGVKLILCDGLAGVNRDMADTVIIAGMGGEVMSGIISRAPFLRDSGVKLILQPMRGAIELREYLAQNGFFVEVEHAIGENGKIYSVMEARFSDESYKLSAARRFIGLLQPDSAYAMEYIKKQYNICKSVAKSLENIPEKMADYELYSSAAADIKRLLEENNGI